MGIPVIDLFAGPGGLSEGFSLVNKNGKRVFDIKLSVEMEKYAIKTLQLRSFYRQFEKNEIPAEYYKILEEKNLKIREGLAQRLYENNNKEFKRISNEIWDVELGSNKDIEIKLDKKIEAIIRKNNHWLLIGGPPCQAYSLVGRSRVGGINKNDTRVYLYREYLRIIAKHQPSIFVMENVKGLLSATVNDENIFDLMKYDLYDPSVIAEKSKKYKIFSFVKKPDKYTKDGFPVYKNNSDFVIKSELYGIPQKRHRIILLGIREDLDIYPGVLKPENDIIKLKEVIGDLPKIRSGLQRKYLKSEYVNGKKKRIYEDVEDGNKNWSKLINSFKKEIISCNGFSKKDYKKNIIAPKNGIGSEFINCNSLKKENRHLIWYSDPKLKGISNHKSRSHLIQDLKRYLFASLYTDSFNRFPRLHEYLEHSNDLLPDHKNAKSGKFNDRFRVQLPYEPATTITSHIAKDGHYFIHYDYNQCRSLTVREAARIQTFPDNYLFCGPRTAQYNQVGNAVPPYLAFHIGKIVSDIINKTNSKKCQKK